MGNGNGRRPVIPPAQAKHTQAAANMRGILLIMIGMGAFVLNDTLTKKASVELPVGQILAIRGVFACLFLAPFAFFIVRFDHLKRCYSSALLIRNISEIAAAILVLNALFRLPIANVTAILQTVPLTLTAAAAILLKESVGWRRWLAATVGLLGILLVIRPGSTDFSWWYVAAVLCVFFVTARDMSTRFINASIPSVLIAFITALIVMLAGFVVGFFEVWVFPSLASVFKLACAAILVLIGYYTLIECWRDVEISVIAPFRYSIVLWSMAFGYLLLGEVPNAWTIAGSGIVVSAGLYTLHREKVRYR